jgi:hypothetical protein
MLCPTSYEDQNIFVSQNGGMYYTAISGSAALPKLYAERKKVMHQ